MRQIPATIAVLIALIVISTAGTAAASFPSAFRVGMGGDMNATIAIAQWAEQENHLNMPTVGGLITQLRDQQGVVMDDAETLLRGTNGLNPATEGLSTKRMQWGGWNYGS